MICRLSWWTIWSWVRRRGLWSATNSEIWSRFFSLKTSKKKFHFHLFLFLAIYIWQWSGKVYKFQHSVSTYSSSESFKVVDIYPPSPTCDLWCFNLISTITQITGCTFRGLDCLTTIDSDDEDSFIMDYEVFFLEMFSALILIDQRQSGVRFTETASTFSPPMSLLVNPHWLEPAMDSVLNYR